MAKRRNERKPVQADVSGSSLPSTSVPLTASDNGSSVATQRGDISNLLRAEIASITKSLTDAQIQWRKEADEIRAFAQSQPEAQVIPALQPRTPNPSRNSNINELLSRLETLEQNFNGKLQNLSRQVSTISKSFDLLSNKLDDLEQYGRRSCLLLHGIPEDSSEDPFKTASDFFRTNLNIHINVADIINVHRLGRPQSSSSHNKVRPRPIIIKFVYMRQRDAIFSAKKCLKGSHFLITESLTKDRNELFKALKQKTPNCWSHYGTIFTLDRYGKKIVIRNFEDLSNFEL